MALKSCHVPGRDPRASTACGVPGTEETLGVSYRSLLTGRQCHLYFQVGKLRPRKVSRLA